MKVLDLQCSAQHSFEGWFASEDDFQHQLQAQLLECPLCGTTGVVALEKAAARTAPELSSAADFAAVAQGAYGLRLVRLALGPLKVAAARLGVDWPQTFGVVMGRIVQRRRILDRQNDRR